MNKTQDYYFPNRKIKELKRLINSKNVEKKISIMEMVPKRDKSHIIDEDDNISDISTWASSLKSKQTNSKQEIRAKLEFLRTNSVDRGRRRCLNTNSTVHYPFYSITNK
mmetsp:Transcript_27316/g.24198  ORF Transcript_27316/g.24198 Transcript_27316/m.24198 type:complete len:109 (+) Transcript_27316:1263-1589(+)